MGDCLATARVRRQMAAAAVWCGAERKCAKLRQVLVLSAEAHGQKLTVFFSFLRTRHPYAAALVAMVTAWGLPSNGSSSPAYGRSCEGVAGRAWAKPSPTGKQVRKVGTATASADARPAIRTPIKEANVSEKSRRAIPNLHHIHLRRSARPCSSPCTTAAPAESAWRRHGRTGVSNHMLDRYTHHTHTHTL